MTTHKSATSEAGSLTITACLSAIGFNRAGKRVFNAQMIHLDAPCICLGLYPPMRTHFLNRRKLISQMVCTFLFRKSYGFLHGYNTCIGLHFSLFQPCLIGNINKLMFLGHNHARYQLIIINRLMICKSCAIIDGVGVYTLIGKGA